VTLSGAVTPMTDEPRSLDEITADLEALVGQEADDSPKRVRLDRIRNAQANAKHCAECGRQFANKEPMWRVKMHIGQVYGGGAHYWLAPICTKCRRKPPKDAYIRNEQGQITHVVHASWLWRTLKWSGPCVTCGRPIRETAEWTWKPWKHRRRRHYCCDRCRRAGESAYQAEIARQNRAEVRGLSRPCVTCGEHFEPSRNDSQYCSSPCRQKAYRRRVTVDPRAEDAHKADQ
jgi:hypothetical protein